MAAFPDAFVVAAKQDAKGDMDGIPVALMEAMSQHVPVVSTRLSGIPELVIHERTGLLAAPADPADLARHLRRAAGRPGASRRGSRKQATRHVESEFGQQANLTACSSTSRPRCEGAGRTSQRRSR